MNAYHCVKTGLNVKVLGEDHVYRGDLHYNGMFLKAVLNKTPWPGAEPDIEVEYLLKVTDSEHYRELRFREDQAYAMNDTLISHFSKWHPEVLILRKEDRG